MLAHTTSSDETLALLLLFAGLWTGWAARSRIRGRGFPRVPLGVAWAGVTLAIVLVALSLVAPRRIFPGTAAVSPAGGPRPASTATIAIVRPQPSAAASGDELEVVMTLAGGRIVDTTSTNLAPDTGHIHLSVDGVLVSMTTGLVQVIDIRSLPLGEHRLTAEFVAADHGPFDPRVTATVTFVKEAAT
jgi:hypothetical protein